MLPTSLRPFTAERPAVVRPCRRVRRHSGGGADDGDDCSHAAGAEAHAALRSARRDGRAHGALRRLRNAHPVSGGRDEGASPHARAASLFDVSHMGQIALRPSGGKLADVALALERLVPVDVLGLAPGRQRYAYFTNAHGGIIDDLMITACGDHLALVVNASRKEVDEAALACRPVAGLHDGGAG